MSLEEARELATALNTVTATYLLCLDDEGSISAPKNPLLNLYRHADDRGKETILRIAEAQAD